MSLLCLWLIFNMMKLWFVKVEFWWTLQLFSEIHTLTHKHVVEFIWRILKKFSFWPWKPVVVIMKSVRSFFREIRIAFSVVVGSYWSCSKTYFVIWAHFRDFSGCFKIMWTILSCCQPFSNFNVLEWLEELWYPMKDRQDQP